MVGRVLVLFLSWGLVDSDSVKTQLICSQQPITALVGDDVILPCHLQPPVSAADWTVEWSKPGLDPESVHYHENGRLKFKEQNPLYSFRTRLFMDDMKTGNVSMKIFKVEESDSGIYKCFLPSIKKEASIELIVGDPVLMASTKPVQAKVGDDVVLQCRLEPILDVTNMLVEWRQNQTIVHVYRDRKDAPELQNERFRGRTSLFHQEMTRGNISLKLSRVTEEDSGGFTCFIPKLEKGRVTLVVGRTACDWAVAFTIFFLPLVAVIAAFIIVVIAKPMKRRYPDPETNGVDRIRLSSWRHNSGSAGERKKHPVSKPDPSPDASQKKCHIIIGTTVIGIILTITIWTLNLKRLCFFNK
ncbi:uncharacterized protein V6R79_022086 [Siganus canaliculatus]